MFADFGIVNFWTYLLGATLIVLAPGPETMFVIKTSITSGVKQGFAAIFSILMSDVLLVLPIFSISVSRRYALSLSPLSKRVRKRNL